MFLRLPSAFCLLPSGLSHFAIRHSKFAMGHASVPHYARLVGARPSCYKMEALSHRSPDRRETEVNPCRFQGGAWSAVHPSCKREGVSVPRPQASRDRPVENLSKRYRIGPCERHRALRDVITDAFSSPFCRLRNVSKFAIRIYPIRNLFLRLQTIRRPSAIANRQLAIRSIKPQRPPLRPPFQFSWKATKDATSPIMRA